MFRFASPVFCGIVFMLSGCGEVARHSLEREIDISVRCSLGQLSDLERDRLFKDSHPVLYQMANPSIRIILGLFAELPPEQRANLTKSSFLKWQFSQLEASLQNQIQTALEIMLVNSIPSASEQIETAVELLWKSKVGFIEHLTADNGTGVICFYILWADASRPSYLPLIGSFIAQPPSIEKRHFEQLLMDRIVMLRAMSDTEPPRGTTGKLKKANSMSSRQGILVFNVMNRANQEVAIREIQ